MSAVCCPSCFGDLREVQDGQVCTACGTPFPTLGGVSVLMADADPRRSTFA